MRLVVVTGGLGGFGRAVATEWLRANQDKPFFMVLTTSKINTPEWTAENDGNQFKARLDLSQSPSALGSQIAALQARMDAQFREMRINNHSDDDELVLINNAGTLGQLGHVWQLDAGEMSAALQLNVSGTMQWTVSMLRWWLYNQALSADDNAHGFRRSMTVVNISSLAALQPFDCWSVYCAGKAARDMFHRSLALECPNVRVLNYAPGPMDTDMQRRIREEMPDDASLKRDMRSMFERGQLVRPEDSARRLCRLLARNVWANGAHIDYYDVDDDGQVLTKEQPTQ